MSLINDALKKAQTLQARPTSLTPAFPRPNPVGTTDATPAADAPAAVTPVTPKPLPAAPVKKSPAVAMMGIAGLVLVLGLGALGYVVHAIFFSASPVAAIAPATPTVEETPVAAPTTVADATEMPPAPEAAVTREAIAPVASPVASTPISEAPAPTTVAASPEVNPEPTPEPVAQEPAVHVNNPAPALQAWVDKISVAGIRAGDRPKVLMNDRLFVIGDVVNAELGLKLSKVADQTLEFSDADGNTYEYRF